MENSANQTQEIKSEQDFINYLVDVALLREDLNRAVFYENTINMDEGAIIKLKGTVEKIALESLKNAPKDEREAARIQRRVERCLHSIFTPWNRLAGRMESAILAMDGTLTESALASIGRRFYELPEYEQYLTSSFKGFIFNRCVDYNLDYTQMPQEFKLDSLEFRFLSDYPFNVEAKAWDILDLAYEYGMERVVPLQEDPSPINGHIGGETKMTRVLRLNNFGPELKDGVINGRATGIGLIDYKDCTNAFVIIDYTRTAINIFSLKPRERRQVLESVCNRCGFINGQKFMLDNFRIKAKSTEMNPHCDIIDIDCIEQPNKIHLQIECIGRCEVPIKLNDTYGIVQKVGNTLKFQDHHSVGICIAKTNIVSNQFNVDGKLYTPESQMNCMHVLEYGGGIWAKDSDGNRAYLAFSIEKQGLIVTKPYSQAKREAALQRLEKSKEAERKALGRKPAQKPANGLAPKKG